MTQPTSHQDLIRLSAARLGELIARREVTAIEVTRAFLGQISAVEETVRAFLHVDEQDALAQAAAVDARLEAGEQLGPLAGVPIAVKDLYCTAGVPTTAGSRMLADWRPPYDATVIEKVRQAGLVVLGKTNLDEFAMGSSTETSAFGETHNPWDPERVPGGSGGGSAACLAAFEAPLALGTDTGGSIRQPGALTGTVGVKPTFGGVSRYGVIAMASSLDQPGPCARNVLDAALLHEVIAGHDPLDSTSIDAAVPPVVAAAKSADVRGLRIGVVSELSGAGFSPGVEQRFDEAVALLAKTGAEIVEVSCPNFKYSMPAYQLIMSSEASSNLARYDGMRYGLRVGDDGSRSTEEVMALSRAAGFGDEVKRRILVGTHALSSGHYEAYYGKGQRLRTLIAGDFADAFESVDVLVSPTTPTTAFRIGEQVDDPLTMYASDMCTIPSNMAGNAAASFPCGLTESEGLPVGIQVIAPAMADDRVYLVGAAVEKALSGVWGGSQCDVLADSAEWLGLTKEA